MWCLYTSRTFSLLSDPGEPWHRFAWPPSHRKMFRRPTAIASTMSVHQRRLFPFLSSGAHPWPICDSTSAILLRSICPLIVCASSNRFSTLPLDWHIVFGVMIASPMLSPLAVDRFWLPLYYLRTMPLDAQRALSRFVFSSRLQTFLFRRSLTELIV
jgi:hypothetical protein